MKNVMRMMNRTVLMLAGGGMLAAIATGCVRPYAVPAFSQLVAEAPAQTASFQAPDDGSVYVEGPGKPGQPRHLAYSGLVRRGEVVTVDPTAGQLLINGKIQAATIEQGHGYYQIWYRAAHNEVLGY